MRKKAALLLSLCLMISMTGCQGGGKPESTDTSNGQTKQTSQDSEKGSASRGGAVSGDIKKMVIVLPNVRGDGGTHDLACRAAEGISKENGASLDIVELGSAVTDSAKWQAAMEDLCEEGYDLVITGGSLMKDTIQTVAPDYPEVPFICYDVSLDFETINLKNAYAMDFHQNEAGYMAGVIAASTSQSDYIGFVGATKIPIIYDFLIGYIAGAKAANPDIKVAVAWTNDYNDATLAKELSLAQISDGVDVLFPACGNAAAGVYGAARDSKIWAVGNDLDVAAKYAKSDETIEKIILASVMKKVDNAVTDAYGKYIEGTLPFGKQETVGVAENGAGVVKNAAYEAQVTEEVRNKVTEIENKITSGEIKVPTAIGMDAGAIESTINSAQ